MVHSQIGKACPHRLIGTLQFKHLARIDFNLPPALEIVQRTALVIGWFDLGTDGTVNQDRCATDKEALAAEKKDNQ